MKSNTIIDKEEKLVSVYKSSAPPFPTAVMANTFVMPMDKNVGLNDYYRIFYDVVTHKSNHWYFPESDVDRITPQVVDVLLSDINIFESCREHYITYINQLNTLLDRNTLVSRLKRMSADEMALFFAKVCELYRTASYYVEPPNFSLEIGGHDIVKQQFQAYFATKGLKLTGSEFEKYFACLISFPEMSFVQEIELSLLKIACLPKQKRPAAIKAHAENYYWKVYDYYGPILDETTIIQELKPLLALSRVEIQKRIKGIEDGVVHAKQQLEKNLARYPLPKKLLLAAEIIRKFAYLYSDFKKRHTSQANVGLGMIIQFLAEKYGLEAFHLHYATFEELLDLIQHSKVPDGKELEARTVSSVVVLEGPERYYRFLTEEQAQNVLRRSGNLNQEKVNSLKGMPANSGKYTGPARVCTNVSQIIRVQVGDVLIAPMTTVGYVPAMKKAGAIITDIGGITSHAAIVSRELGVPCIVGLKTATTTFRDGDMVEVNANHGIVKKV